MGLSALSVKPLAITLVISIAALLASNGFWWVHATVVKAERDTAQAGVRELTTARNAFGQRVAELTAANKVYDAEYAKLANELERAQQEMSRVNAEGERAVAAAQAKAAESERVLKTFLDRYAQQIRAPDCALALANLSTVCPKLEGY